MLSYLILTTQALTLAAVICGAALGYTKISCEKKKRKIVWIAAVIGVGVSIFVAVMRNATSKLDSAVMNGWIYGIFLAAFILFLVIRLTPLRKRTNGVTGTVSWVLLGILTATVLVYALQDVWGYPYHILLSEKTVISTDFLLSIIGMIIALILMAVLFFAVMKCTMRFTPKGAAVLLILVLALNAVLRLAGFFSVLFQKKIIASNHTLFVYTVFAKNNSDLFVFLSLLFAAAAAIILVVRSIVQKEPYRNPAEHRQIKAKWRNVRRWSGTAVAAAVCCVLVMTIVVKMNEKDVTLSPIEEASAVDDENVYVDFDLVSDGHLHRFAYETERGVVIRFIVIKKPNSSAYGIGLDACDVCGETGYYERDGQVVCNLCDVVMNISTIGFKGGCNPIVIPYEISDGQIIVPIYGLLEYESEFK